ncbi:undecaprenyl-diphosphate phosphatase [Marinactinospora thermotolerans]|uniref:Undecaprenyl-diphosphatase n=1 Tax=Marinactinospora thermotolerans DSM 45154 TaxID=1122192 RepID=A0A1T4T7H2_9ACTN|nr:undecaprenyl-diphosphate phosphatase [Marinactinospora thermotolerans]SKA36128.1 Undecaprenyl-diphosphatase [Marinactinospora thermotolerans DSM 45154]
MSIFEAIILGLVQGLTEFLPISSSGHLRVVAAFSGWPDPGAAFTAVTQIGTELAVLIYFRKDVWNILSTWTRSLVRKDLRRHIDARMGWYVILGSLPIGIAGLLFEEPIDSFFRDLRLTALTLIIFGVILGVVDHYSRKHRELTDLTVGRGLTYGLFQMLALVPGVSRSGATVTGGMLMGFKREAAARYAFLLAMPAVFASGVYKLKDIGGNEYAGWGATLVGTVIAFGVGYAVIAWFMRFISTNSFMPFVYYRIALGILILTLVSFGKLDPSGGAEAEGVGGEEVTISQEAPADSTPSPEPSPSVEPSPSASVSTDPVTGWPIDPETGLARDPETGQHKDPVTGELVQIDPGTGLPIDPYTGQPYDPLVIHGDQAPAGQVPGA